MPSATSVAQGCCAMLLTGVGGRCVDLVVVENSGGEQ